MIAPRAAALSLALLAALAACSKSSDDASGSQRPALMSEAELERARDACAGYVERVCECARTVPAAHQPCTLARALPEALQVATELGTNPETERRDVRQSADIIRKTVKECIEQTARLPALGCK